MIKYPVTLLAALMLGACGSPPTLSMPDGGARSPANNQADIDDYIAGSPRHSGAMPEHTTLGRQVEAVTRDVATLKLYMAAMAAQLESRPAPPSGGAAVARIEAKPASEKAGPRQTTLPTEAIKLADDSVMFRIMFATGGSAFTPSKDFEQRLLKAANEGRHVEIRSASDAGAPSASNEKVVKERAESARQYLLAHGVPPEKIKTRLFTAGAFIADNTTSEGRSKNRRTEIEVTGLGTSAYRDSEKQLGGATQ